MTRIAWGENRCVYLRCASGDRVSAMRLAGGWVAVWRRAGRKSTKIDTETCYRTAWGAAAHALRQVRHMRVGAHVVDARGRRGLVVRHSTVAHDVVRVVWDGAEVHPFLDNAEPINVRDLCEVRA